MAEPVICPDCRQEVHAIVCRGPKPKPMTDEAKAALAELLIAMHKRMGGCVRIEA